MVTSLVTQFLANVASVSQADMERTWNCGTGMRAIVDPAIGDLVIRSLTALGMSTWIVWMVEPSNDYTLLRSYLVSE